MNTNPPNKPEIDRQTIKLIIGLIALSLPILTSLFSNISIQSISASYHYGGISRDVFVGFLFAIAAFLIAYNGKSFLEMVLSKLAALAALGVALFPCECGGNEQIIPYVHGVSAFVMFTVLAVFCLVFYNRAFKKGHPQALIRAKIYAVSGLLIVLSMLILGLDGLAGFPISSKFTRLVFYCEALGLIAFGVSWLVASRILPVITSSQERCTLSPFKTQ